MHPFRPWEDHLPPPQAFQTFELRSPHDVRIKAACEQVQCQAWRAGWRSLIDESTDLGRTQAAYIRARSGRTFTERPGPGGLTEFAFDSGQRCFADHRTRPEIYLVVGGDWRGNPTGHQRRHTRPIDWVEDFAEHQLRVADQHQKG
jgi:hypothetical protein